jgi:hypothetical protein
LPPPITRSNRTGFIRFALRQKTTLKRTDLDEFVRCFHPENRHERKESGRFKGFAYDELLKRDKVNLDIFWLRDESLEDSANLPDPDVLALEIADELEAALEQFAGAACFRDGRDNRTIDEVRAL